MTTTRFKVTSSGPDYTGYHQFNNGSGPYGSFQVFWHDEPLPGWNGVPAGWYWWACFPGCLPDAEPSGPFSSSEEAHDDAMYDGGSQSAAP